jgi:hypothetical protein
MKIPTATWRAEILNEAARLEAERERAAAARNGATDGDANDRLAAGAVGGIFAGGFALRRLQAYGGPYALPLWQALLRVPFGAAGAPLRISIMQSGLITAVKPQDNSDLIPYALSFGYAPDYLLRLLDRKVNEVSESARTKNDPVRGRRPG